MKDRNEDLRRELLLSQTCGTPLIELNVRVNDPALARIDNDDVVRALRTLVEGTAPKFANATESGTRPSARSLAFHAHYIANATAFLSKLSGKVFQ